MSNLLVRLTFLATIALVLGGCASGLYRQADSQAARQASTERVSEVIVRLGPEAQKKAPDNPGFSTDALASVLKNHIRQRNMLDSGSTIVLDVEVTDFRVRSTAAAVLFGFMAGTDNLSGDVRLRGPDRGTAPSTVTASYALGGLVGGQDGNRMGWLYEEFAKLVAAELYGENK